MVAVAMCKRTIRVPMYLRQLYVHTVYARVLSKFLVIGDVTSATPQIHQSKI